MSYSSFGFGHGTSYFGNSAVRHTQFGGLYTTDKEDRNTMYHRMSNPYVRNGGPLVVSFGTPPDMIVGYDMRTGQTIKKNQCVVKKISACGNCTYPRNGGYNPNAGQYPLAQRGERCCICGCVV